MNYSVTIKQTVFNLALTLIICCSIPGQAKEMAWPALKLTQTPQQLQISWPLPKTLVLYPQSIKIMANNSRLHPKIAGHYEQLRHHTVLSGPVTATFNTLPPHVEQLVVHFQGCTRQGVCYPPQQQVLQLKTSHDTAAWIVIITLFVAGIGLAFTPCALPIAPLVIASIYNPSNTPTWRKASGFLLGLTTAYGLLGASIYWLGLPLQQMTQTPIILIILSTLSILMGLTLLDLHPKLTQRFYQCMQRCLPQKNAGRNYPASLMGAITMLVATPCVAPPMLTALAWASHTHAVWPATIGMASMGFGLGLPATVAAAAGHRITTRLTNPTWIQPAIGLLLILLAAVFLSRVMPVSMLLGLTAIWCGLAGYTLVKQHRMAGKHASLCVAVLMLCGVTWLGFLIKQHTTHLDHTTFQSLNHQRNLVLPKTQAYQRGSLIYFHADWCSTCRHLERTVLSHPTIRKKLHDWRVYEVDLTTPHPTQQAWQKKFQVLGPPALIFLDPKGQVIGKIFGNTNTTQLYQHLHHRTTK